MDVEDTDAFILILEIIEIVFFQPGGKFGKFGGFHALSVIGNGNKDIFFSCIHTEKDPAAGRNSVKSVFDAVFYKGLENQLDNVAVQAAFINFGMEGEFAAEPYILDINVVVHVVDFLGKGDDAGGIMVDTVAQQSGETGVYLTGSIVFLHFDEGVDDLQGIKEEMGIDLSLESHEFCVLFFHFHDVIFVNKLVYLSHHPGERGVENADFIVPKAGGGDFQVSLADLPDLVQYNGKAFVYAYGKGEARRKCYK